MFAAIRRFRILSLFLTGLFLVSTSGICLDFHYCQGNFKTYKFYGKAESCHKKALRTGNSNTKVCHHKSELERKSCCKNEMSYAKLAIEYNDVNHLNKSSDIAQQPVLVSITDFLNKHLLKTKEIKIFKFHKPPLPERKLYFLFQQILC